MNPAARLLAPLLGHEARITDEQWSEVRAMSNERLCACGHDWNDHKKPRNKISWDACSFPCSMCDCPEYDSTNKMTTALYNQLADLRAQIEALANEMETAERGVRLQYWIISLRKIAEKEAGENGMDILDRAIDRIEEHSWTQDGPMSDEDDAAIDLLKECREAAERELYAQKEAK